MPTKKNKMLRFQILDELLSDRYHCYSRGDLCDKVNDALAERKMDEVSKRTIEKDLITIQEMYPIGIEEYYDEYFFSKDKIKSVRKKCVRYDDPEFSIYKKELTKDEKYLLSEALSILGQFDGLPDFAGLDRLKKSANVKDDREIVSFTKNPIEDSTVFGKLFTAIANKQVIELHYHTFAEPDQVKINVFHPYLLKEYNMRWYLFAAAFTDGKLLNFALDRINDCVPLPNYKYEEYGGNLNEWFDEIVGVSLHLENPVDHILFWVSDREKGYINTKPIHETQTEQKRKDQLLRAKYPELKGGAFYTIDCRENYELIRELSSFGKDLLVLESKYGIQDKVVKKASEMMEEYNKLRT